MIKQIIIPGKPTAKGRPRFSRIGKFVRTRTPEETINFENKVAICCTKKKPTQECYNSPVVVEIAFYMPRPKSLPKKVIHHTKKPDIDNLIKSILDGMNGIMYKSDSQVFEVRAAKFYEQESVETIVTVIYRV